jgi:hypothetical protein
MFSVKFGSVDNQVSVYNFSYLGFVTLMAMTRKITADWDVAPSKPPLKFNWESFLSYQVPRDSDPRMTALARTNSNYKQQAHPLGRESAPYQQTRNCLTNKNVVLGAGWVLDTMTGRLTLRCNITFEFFCQRG